MCFAFMAMFGLGNALFDQVSLEIQLEYSNGTVVEGSNNFSFNIYNSYTGGTSLYESNQTLTTDSTGLVSVILKNINLNFSDNYYIGLNVNDDGEQTPRINWTDVGTAIKSNNTDYWNGVETSDDFTNIIASGNITTNEYFEGQPLDGGLGPGIIESDTISDKGTINITDNGGLSLSYSGFTVRLQYSNNQSVKYCTFTGDTINISSADGHYSYYVNWNCNLINITRIAREATPLSPGGTFDIFDVFVESEDIELIQGRTILSVDMIKTWRENFNTVHLDILSGFSQTNDVFPAFNMTLGTYLFYRDIKTGTSQSTNIDGMDHVIYTDGVSVHVDEPGLNLTHCTDGTDTFTCANNQYRRYIVYMYGFDNGVDSTKLHQLSPRSTDPTYVTLANCLDTIETPVSYIIDSTEQFIAVPLYMYCGLRDDSAWRVGWLSIKEGVGGGTIPDAAQYVRIDGTTELTNNWATGDLNITSSNGYYTGNTLWNNLVGWDNFTGIPHATPSSGDVNNFSLAGEIYDWVIGLGYSTTTGTVTSVATGNGISGGTITTTGTLTVSGNTALTADTDGLSVTNDAIGDTQLTFNTGQHLTDTSDVKFDDINVTGNITFQSGFGVCYNSGCTDYKYYNGTCEITYIGGTTLTICPA